ncbi:MAG: ribonuclease III [Actinobacteria bacterium]|nr:MAG: ribonuclease III [Actinomycetota bacterium]
MTHPADTIARAEAILGYVFEDRSLLERALTHSSYAGEHRTQSYERLEFLGDSVLGFVIAEELFRRFPEAPEGELTKRKIAAVSGENLSAVSEALGLYGLVALGKGERASGGRSRKSLAENVLEAVFGAVYLDGGIAAARPLILRVLADALDAGLVAAPAEDPKSVLQEHTQATLGMLPTYRVTDAEGEPHDRVFTVEVLVAGQSLGHGTGRSKKEAEKAAAAGAIEALELRLDKR